MTKPLIISVGYGTHMFVEGNPERQRMQQCAAHTDHLHMIVFTSRSAGLQTQHVSPQLTLHPTNARHRVGMIIAAVRIALRLTKPAVSPVANTIITTQDAFATGIVGWVIKRVRGVRLVVQEHGDVFLQPYWRGESLVNQVQYKIGLRVLPTADAVRVVSKRIHDKLITLGIPPARLVSLPVSVDLAAFTQKSTYRSATQAAPFQLITAARLVPQKNLTLLLQAFKAAWLQNNQLRLTIVGSGPEQAALTARLQAQYVGVASPVTMVAWSDDVGSLLRAADAYILTSNYEGWARVLIEAMVTGLPTITTQVGCAGEVLLHDVHGMIVPVGDQAALTQAILTMSTDTARYAEFVDRLQQLDPHTIPGTQSASYGQQWVATLAI